MKWILLLSFFLYGCSHPLAHMHEEQRQRDFAFQEMRAELGDLRHSVHAYRAELQILQERVLDQEQVQQNNSSLQSQCDQVYAQVAACERKLLLAEKSLQQLNQEIRALQAHAQQTDQSLGIFKERITSSQRELAGCHQKLESISQLKATLNQISQAVQEKPTKHTDEFYVVRSGDTLADIAKRFHMTTAMLKQVNHLTQDKILVGQKLKVHTDGE